MTPLKAIIGASIRKLFAAIGRFGDVYWGNVSLSVRGDKDEDKAWSKTSVSMHMNQIDPDWGSVVLAMHMDEDKYWGSVVLALHMDGADSGTVFTDGKGKSLTAVGGAVTKTATKKFGTASGYFNGTTSYLTTPNHSDFNFGSGDFTIECWVYQNSQSDWNTVVSKNPTDQAGVWRLVIGVGGYVAFGAYTGSTWFSVNALPYISGVKLNTWTHIAVVRSGNEAYIYVNGVRRGANLAYSVSIPDLANQLTVGRLENTGIWYFDGYIDDLRITKGVGRYTSDFVPPTRTFPDTSFFDEKGHTVTSVGTPTLSSTSSKFGGFSAYFNGSSSYLSLADSVDWSFGSSDFTLECWVNPTNFISAREILAQRDDVYLPDFMFLRSDVGGIIRFLIKNTSVVQADLQSSFPIVAGVFSHIAVVRSGNTVLLFINGVLSNFTSISGAYPDIPALFLIGAANTLSNYFLGYIDDVRVTKGVARYSIPSVTLGDPYFSNNVLLMHMQGLEGSTTFTDVMGKTVTPVGNSKITLADSKFGNASAYFDGVGDYLSVPYSTDFDFGTGDFTIELWFKISGNSSVNSGGLRTAVLVSTLGAAAPANGYSIYVTGDATTTGTAISFVNHVAGTAYTVGVNITVPQGSWIHLAIVRWGGTTTVYKDGVAIASGVLGNQAVNAASNNLVIGRSQFAGYLNEFNGYIDDLRIKKGLGRYRYSFNPVGPHPDIYGFNAVGSQVFDPPARSFREPSNTTTFYDAKGHEVTVLGTPTINTVTKKFGNGSASFNGSTDYLVISETSDLGFGVGDFTVECWINTASSSSALLDFRKNPEMPHLYFYLVNGHASMWNGMADCEGSIAVNTSAWVHLVWCRYHGVLSQYVDGVLDASIPSTLNLGTERSLVIGATYAGSFFYTGYLDDLRVTKGLARYEGPFSAPTKAFPDPYSRALFVEDTGKVISAIGTVEQSSVNKYGSGALYFNGSGNNVTSIADSADLRVGATGQFTVELWARFLALPNTGTQYNLIQKGYAATSNLEWQLSLQDIAGVTGYKFTYTTDGVSAAQVGVNFTPTLGQWYHLACVRTSTNLILFIDGVVVYDSTFATSLFQGAGAVTIGANGVGENSFYGYFDDIRITVGVARYVSSFSPPDRLNPNYYKDRVDPYLGNVVLGMHMDGADNGTTFLDITGTSISRTGNPVTKTGTKKLGTASLYLDGASTANFLSGGVSSKWALGGGAFTIEAWIYLNSYNSSGGRIISAAGGGALAYNSTNGVHWSLEVTSSGVWFPYYNGSGSGSVSAAVSLATWTHIAVSYDGTTVRLFKNGVLSSSSTSPVVAPSTTPTLCIGKILGDSVGATFAANIYLDDVRITKGLVRYTGNFIPAQYAFPEVVSLVNPQLGDPYLGNVVLGMHMDGADNGTVFAEVTGKTVTVYGDTKTKIATKKFGTASAYFDGTGDYLSVPYYSLWNFTSGDFTVEAWVNPSLAFTRCGICGQRSDTNPASSGWAFVIYDTTGALVFYFNGASSVSGSLVVPVGSWSHVAATMNSGTLRLFLNGVLDAYGTPARGIESLDPLWVGREGSSSSTPMNGYIDDLRITRGVARYTTTFTPPARFPDIPAEDYYDPYFDNVTLLLHCDGLDNGTAFTDVKGKVATRSGNVVTKTGVRRFGTASLYSPNVTTGDKLAFSASSGFIPDNGYLTIELFFNLTSYNASGGRMLCAGGGAVAFNATNGINWILQSGATGASFQYWNGSTSPTLVVAASLNTWYHFSAVSSSSGVSLFLDGVLVASNASPIALTATLPSLEVCSVPGEATNSTQKFGGYLDDIRITRGVARYSSNFTAPYKAYQNQRSVAFDPFWDSTVLLLNMDTNVDKKQHVMGFAKEYISTTQSKFGGKSLYLNGAGQYITTPSSTDFAFGTANFTIEMFIRLDSLGVERALVDNRANVSDTGLYISISSTNYLTVYGNNGTIVTALSAFAAATWYHIVVEKVAGDISIWIDGVYSTYAASAYPITCPGTFVIGRKFGSTVDDFAGYIDDLRITKGVARYYTTFAVPAYPHPVG